MECLHGRYSLRPLPGLFFVLLLTGCHAAPVASIDGRLLDSVAVLPVLLPSGGGTVLLLENGTMLSCSHSFPRGQSEGEARIGGRPVHYTVLESGDQLALEWPAWIPSSGTPGTSRLPAAPDSLRSPSTKPCLDWAVVSTEPRLSAAEFLNAPLTVNVSHDPPAPGETVYMVAYTVEAAVFVRYWAALEVIQPRAVDAAAYGDSNVWLKLVNADFGPRQPLTKPPAKGEGRPAPALRGGFSGAPVLRQTGPTTFEVCAIFIGRNNESASRIGVAIPVPEVAVATPK